MLRMRAQGRTLAVITLLALVSLVAGLASRGNDEEGTPALPATSTLVGHTRRGEGGVAADLLLYRFQAIDLEDPFRVFTSLDFSLRPAAGASEPLARTRSGEDGAFSFSGLLPGLYEVHATDAKGAVAVTPFAIRLGGIRTEIRVVLPPTSTRLEGRALRADGSPFTGLVEVRETTFVLARAWRSAGSRVTHTDPDGHFVFDGLETERLVLSLVEPGLLRYEVRNMDVPPEGDLVLRLPGPLPSLSGEVVADESGVPIPGGRCTAVWHSFDRDLVVRVEVDAAGHFDLSLPEGERTFVIEAPNRQGHVVRMGPGEHVSLSVSLARTASVRGRVVNWRTGQPAAGALVQARVRSLWDLSSFPLDVARADDQGRFELAGLPPRAVELMVMGGGWASRWLDEIMASNWEIDPLSYTLTPGETRQVTLEAERLGAVAGRVLDPDGVPIAEALVVGLGMIARSDCDLSLLLDAFVWSAAASDASGRFVLQDFQADRPWHVEVEAVGHPLGRSEDFDVRAGKTTEIDVRMGRARHLDVIVNAVDGGNEGIVFHPIAGARVWASIDNRDWPQLSPSVWRTDEKGRVKVGPLPDQAGEEPYYEIGAWAKGTVFPPWRLGGCSEIEDTGEEPLPARIGLVLTSRRVRGLVRAPEGIPVGLASVTSRPADGFLGGNRRARVSKDGRFLLTLIPGVKMVVSASLSWAGEIYQARVDLAEDDDTIELDLAPFPPAKKAKGKLLRIHVLDAAGLPVAGGQVTAYPAKAPGPATSVQIEDGVAVFGPWDPGDQVYLCVDEVADPALGRVAFGPIQVSREDVNEALAPGKHIRGRIVDPLGKGLRGVQVRIYWPVNEDRELALGAGRTGDDGSFDLGAFAPGDYRIRLRIPETVFQVPPLILLQPGGDPITIRLRRPEK